MRLGDRVGDRETEPHAALRARARAVCTREAVEDPVERLRRHAASLVRHLDHDLATGGIRAQRDHVVRLRVLHGVLEQRVESASQRLGVRVHDARHVDLQPPRARRHLRPAHEDVVEEALELDVAHEDEVGLIGLRQQQQPVDDVLDPLQLVERDQHLGCMRHLALQELEMATGDRHGRAQLVRRVVEEPLLALEQRCAGLRERLHLVHRRLTAPRMPHHRHEHRAHQRHLEQLAPELDAVECVAEDARAGSEDDDGEHRERHGRRPDSEPVDDRQADPDEVERDRLPARPGDHRGEVGERERPPPALDPVTPQPAGIPHSAPSRSGPRARASAAVSGRRRRRRSSRGRSRSPRPRRAAARG